MALQAGGRAASVPTNLCCEISHNTKQNKNTTSCYHWPDFYVPRVQFWVVSGGVSYIFIYLQFNSRLQPREGEGHVYSSDWWPWPSFSSFSYCSKNEWWSHFVSHKITIDRNVRVSMSGLMRKVTCIRDMYGNGWRRMLEAKWRRSCQWSVNGVGCIMILYYLIKFSLVINTMSWLKSTSHYMCPMPRLSKKWCGYLLIGHANLMQMVAKTRLVVLSWTSISNAIKSGLKWQCMCDFLQSHIDRVRRFRSCQHTSVKIACGDPLEV